MLDIEEYAKAKGIPVESIPADVFHQAQNKSFDIRKSNDPMADTFKQMCTKSQELFKACVSDSGVRHYSSFEAFTFIPRAGIDVSCVSVSDVTIFSSFFNSIFFCRVPMVLPFLLHATIKQ